MYLKVFNESSTPLRRPPYTLRRWESRQRRIPHHALGTCGQLSLQALQEQRTSAELREREGTGEQREIGE